MQSESAKHALSSWLTLLPPKPPTLQYVFLLSISLSLSRHLWFVVIKEPKSIQQISCNQHRHNGGFWVFFLLLTLYHLKNSFSNSQLLLIPLLSRTLSNLALAPARQPSPYCPIQFSTHPSS
ncbi:hypothetical protein ACE6H2_009843 [Prunus campanulata]